MTNGSLEFVWNGDMPLTLERHGFISSIVTAWSNHLPLVLKPEHIWQLVLHGISAHVNANPEGARDRFVDFEGKRTLAIRRDHFVKGSQSNDWGGAVDEFGHLLSKNVKPAAQAVFGTGFSTASRADQLCGKLSAMAMCKNFFEYKCMTRCGFPTITLLGTVADWQQLRQKAEQGIHDLCSGDFAAKWLPALLPVLDRFVQAYQGQVDSVFWNSMIKRGGRSGSGGFTGYTGWFNVFFPLMRFLRWTDNPFCVPYSESADYARAGLRESWVAPGYAVPTQERRTRLQRVCRLRDACLQRVCRLRGADPRAADKFECEGAGDDKKFAVMDSANYPDGTDQVPMTWEYYDIEFPMEFVSGFVGYTQDPETRAVMPVLSWYLLDKTPSVRIEDAPPDHKFEDRLAYLRAQLDKAGKAGALYRELIAAA